MLKKKRNWALVGILFLSTLFAGCSTPSASSQKTDQTKVGGGNANQVTSLDVTKIKVDQYFPNHEGTFILRDLGTNQTFVYNEERAKAQQSPNSTFKVANALIGLQVGAVKDEYEVKRWDGVKRDLPVWNQDHTLASGMRYSVVWYYQAMARDIGNERMQEWLNKINYGNKDISGGIDKFWLNSSLKISPLEEVDFISNLVQEKLPFDKKKYEDGQANDDTRRRG